MSILSDLDDLVLRDTNNPPLTNKGAELTYGQLDNNFIAIYNALQSVVSGVNVTAYDAGRTYDQFSADVYDQFASYDSRIWKAAYAGSPSGFSGQTPEEGVYWTQVTLAEMLPNVMELAKFSANIKPDLSASPIYETDWQSFTNQDLNSNPVDITGLEAKGTGIAVIPVAIDFALEAGVMAYDFPVTGIRIVYNGFTDAIVSVSQSLVNSGTDAYGTFKVQDSTAIKTNTKMQLYALADATQGTGTYYIKTYYKVVTMPF